jgi:TPR repeat protein
MPVELCPRVSVNSLASIMFSAFMHSLTCVIVALLLSASSAIAGGCEVSRYDGASGLRLCRSLAEQGDAIAQFDLALLYARGSGVQQDYAEAVKWYRKSAEQGYVIASVMLGDMYNVGRDVPHDSAEAAKWYLKAAEQGATNVQADLASLYEQGQNYAEAAMWYREAAEDGDRHGQFGLGRLYADGNGVPQDYVLAHMWLNLAAAQGLEDAKSARDRIVFKMTPEQTAEAQRLAREWKPTK